MKITAKFANFRGFGYRMLVWPGRKGRERRGLDVGGETGGVPQMRRTEMPDDQPRAIEPSGEIRVTES